MASPPANANGHRRRQIRGRVLAEEGACALCGGPVDKTLSQIHGPGCDNPKHIDNRRGCTPHPMGPVVDEDLPRSRGGSPLDRSNVKLMHRLCNERKGDRTINEHQEREARGHGGEHGAQSPQLTPTNLVNW